MKARLKADLQDVWQYVPLRPLPRWVAACVVFEDDGPYLVRGPDKQLIEPDEWLIRDLDGRPQWMTDDDFRKSYDLASDR